MRRRDIVFIAGILNLFIATSSGQKILSPEIYPSDARVDNIIIDNGKAGQSVYSLMQDSRGFIWCGTESGLYRFDGIRSLKYWYGKSDTTIAGYIATCMYEEPGGNIWVGTHGALNRINYNNRTISHFIPDSADLSGPDNYIRLIRQDRKGRTWIMTDRNVFRLDIGASVFERFFVDSIATRTREDVLVDERDSFLEDSIGNIWISTKKGLFKFIDSENVWKKVFPGSSDTSFKISPKVNCIKRDNKVIWAGTEARGLVRFSEPGNESYTVIGLHGNKQSGNETPNISTLTITGEGNVWFITGNTISKLDKNSLEITNYQFMPDFTPFPYRKWFPSIRKVFHGKNDELWFLDSANGLVLKFCTETEKIYLYPVPRYFVLDAIKDNTGSFWFGCVAENIFRLIPDSLPYMARNIQNNSSVTSEYIQNMAEDSTGNIILILSSGLYKIKSPALSSLMLPEKLTVVPDGMMPVCVFRDSRYNLWIGYAEGLLQRLSPSGKKDRIFEIPGAPFRGNEAALRVIREDTSGNIWFATYKKGIFRLNKNENTINFVIGYDEITGSEKNGSIFEFFVDRHGKILLSTFDQFYRVDPVSKKVINLSGYEGTGYTYSGMVCRIVEDNKRNLWILNSMNGLFRYDYENNRFIKQFEKYLVPDLGFSDVEFDNRGNIYLTENDLIIVFDTLRKSSRDFRFTTIGMGIHSLKLKTGMLVYIINNRLVVFPPDAVYNKSIPPVYITGIFINGKETGRESGLWQHFSSNDKVELKHDQNSLKIEFAALNYTWPSLNKYRYIMNGVDRDTTISGNNSFAEYRNMAPGRYRFWVTGSNNDGFWNKAGASLEIRIRPPWYMSYLAYGIYLLIVISVIIIYVRLRLRKLYLDKVRLENEVSLRTAELEIKNRKLSEIDRIKTDFFTNISHEIRTPLTLISGPVDLLLNSFEKNVPVAGMLSTIKRNADRLLHLVNELLDISRLDAGKMKLNLSEQDLTRYLRMLVFEFLSLAESKNIRYLAELPEESFITWTDTDKLNKIITNLLSNAFRYTPKGGTVICSAKYEKLEPGLFLKIIVSDTGKGIGQEHLNNIFDRFYRVEGNDETTGYGSGIGLSIVREFVTLMHGEIRVSSQPGNGSSFTVLYQLGKEHLRPDEYVVIEKNPIQTDLLLTAAHEKLHTGQSRSAGSAALAKILLIEDNAEMREFISDNLCEHYHIIEADNGKTGCGLALSMIPDIIISDIMMPDMDGLQLCNKLKTNELSSHIPIILLTARSTLDDKLTGLRSGADEYFVKPFRLDELKIRIENLITGREKLRQKYLDHKSTESLDNKSKSVDDRFMEKVLKTINENINNFDFDVAYLHNTLGISRMHLTRKLKALTGLPPHALVNKIRLEKAAEMLRLKKGNITEIAYSVGISNPANFSKAFKEHFGTSPKAYISRFRNSDKIPL